MTSIPAVIFRIYSNNFKRYYLKKKRFFLHLFNAFLKCAWKLEHFQKKDDYPSLILSEIFDPEMSGFLNV